MKIILYNETLKSKLNGEIREYYQFNNFSLIITKLEPGRVQEYHYHQKLLEVYFIISGKLKFYKLDNKDEKAVTLKNNDMIIFEPGEIHKLENIGSTKARIVTIKQLYDKSNQPDTFLKDKKSI